MARTCASVGQLLNRRAVAIRDRLVGGVEILGVSILDPGRIAPLIREPDEERLQAGERRVDGRGRERLAGSRIGRWPSGGP